METSKVLPTKKEQDDGFKKSAACDAAVLIDGIIAKKQPINNEAQIWRIVTWFALSMIATLFHYTMAETKKQAAGKPRFIPRFIGLSKLQTIVCGLDNAENG